MQYIDTHTLIPLETSTKLSHICSVYSAIFLTRHVADFSLITADTSANKKENNSCFHTVCILNCKQVLILLVKAKRKLRKIGKAT